MKKTMLALVVGATCTGLISPIANASLLGADNNTPFNIPANNAALLARFKQLQAEKPNQDRTAEQSAALQDSYRARYQQLKGDALVQANQERTAEQSTALQDSYRTRYQQLKGDALVQANQDRTAEQSAALQDSYRARYQQLKGDALVQANQERTAEQSAALQDSYRTRYQQLKGDALVKANQERTAEQSAALQDSYRTRYQQLKGDALVQANRERTVEQTEALHTAQQLKAEVLAADSHDATVALAQGVQVAQNTGAYAQSRAELAIINTEANKAALEATNRAMADNTAELANHESRLGALEANTVSNSSFNRLQDRVDENRQRASAGIAGVAAMANIPQVTQGATFSVGAGVGTTDGESALAVGFSARATESTVVKASVSNDSQQNFVVGAGASLQW